MYLCVISPFGGLVSAVQFSDVPSPKSQFHLAISPTGVELSVNVTTSRLAIASVLSAENEATGTVYDLTVNEVSAEYPDQLPRLSWYLTCQ